jgi:hypothetical protein
MRDPRPSRRQRLLRRGLAALLSLYVAASAVSAALGWREGSYHAHHLFPFCSWSFFSLVRERAVRYALRAPDGAPALPPGFEGHFLAQALGDALEKGDAARAQAAASELRARLGPAASWTLMRERFSPLERWRSGAYEEEAAARYGPEGRR